MSALHRLVNSTLATACLLSASFGAFAATGTVTTAAPAVGAQTQSTSQVGAAASTAIIVRTDGPATCNCTDEPSEAEVCVGQSFEVTIGGSTITVTVGVSQQQCQTTTLQPGECAYMQLNASCKKGFWGWSCSYSSSGLKKRQATSDDCGPVPIGGSAVGVH